MSSDGARRARRAKFSRMQPLSTPVAALCRWGSRSLMSARMAPAAWQKSSIMEAGACIQVSMAVWMPAFLLASSTASEKSGDAVHSPPERVTPPSVP